MKFFLLVLFTVVITSDAKKVSEHFWKSTDTLSIDLFSELASTHTGNIAYCTISLQSVLALLTQGAKGETAEQVKAATKLQISNDDIRHDFKTFYTELKDEKFLTFDSANKLYLGKKFTIKPEFQKIAVEDFEAGVENVDFAQPSATAQKINAWVEEKTHNKIKGLVKEDQLTQDTRIALVNAVYIRGKFRHEFPVDNTEPRDFHKSKTETIQAETMSVTQVFSVSHSSELRVSILRIPLENSNTSLNILLPDEIDGLPQLEKNLMKIWSLRNFTHQTVKVFLPKFRIESSFDFIPVLKKLGVKNLFDNADLSGISNEELKVSTIAQKTVVEVNEEGIEAASGTVGLGVNRVLLIPKQDIPIFRADHPFLYAIDYRGVIAISGRLNDPLHP